MANGFSTQCLFFFYCGGICWPTFHAPARCARLYSLRPTEAKTELSVRHDLADMTGGETVMSCGHGAAACVAGTFARPLWFFSCARFCHVFVIRSKRKMSHNGYTFWFCCSVSKRVCTCFSKRRTVKQNPQYKLLKRLARSLL